MNSYIFFYTLSLIFVLYWWLAVFYKYKNLGGLFFFLHTFFASIWLILYFLFYADIWLSEEQKLILTRVNYGISPIALTSLIFFIYFFQKNNKNEVLLKRLHAHRWKLLIYGIFSMILFLVSTFTDWVIKGIKLDNYSWEYREVFGWFASINNVVYITFIPIAIYVYKKQKENLQYVDKIRLSKIVTILLAFLTLLIITQALLPIIWIWILDHEVVILYTISVMSIAWVIKRYYFSPVWYELTKAVSIILSITVISVLVWVLSKEELYLELIDTRNKWINGYLITFTYVSITILVYFIFSYIGRKVIFNKIDENRLENQTKKIKQWMIQFQHLEWLEKYVKEWFVKKFPIKNIHIHILENKEDISYFSKIFSQTKSPVIINDPIYLEENWIEFKYKLLREDIDTPFIFVPIYHISKELIWLFILWEKTNWDFYSSKEIDFLVDFSYILWIHVKYIETYNQLEDISRNLDRKVDEKTIEYNTLISRQKEFIATLSHEIKAPLTSALLQIDNLSADIEDKRLSEVWIQEEVISIGENLVHTKTLLSQLFTTEYLEKNQAVLYPERVNIVELVITQYHIQKRVNLHCTYTEITPENPIFMNLDKTQFTQVLTNLFWNAAKFADNKSPKIHLELEQSGNNVIIGIEDNWIGLSGIELDEIFEKYTIGKNSIGLGIGLYLCKRIVEMHGGTITAKKWKELSWIRMEISIPIGQM